ncbi:hypothetical protein B0H10DRAFT_1939248 [Mycena sp. CBHHK59/15]|nr:hypothetical protein B0H10DRAFT_1939248 [Mycena sp. CBHHK59/15]
MPVAGRYNHHMRSEVMANSQRYVPSQSQQGRCVYITGMAYDSEEKNYLVRQFRIFCGVQERVGCDSGKIHNKSKVKCTALAAQRQKTQGKKEVVLAPLRANCLKSPGGKRRPCVVDVARGCNITWRESPQILRGILGWLALSMVVYQKILKPLLCDQECQLQEMTNLYACMHGAEAEWTAEELWAVEVEEGMAVVVLLGPVECRKRW